MPVVEWLLGMMSNQLYFLIFAVYTCTCMCVSHEVLLTWLVLGGLFMEDDASLLENQSSPPCPPRPRPPPCPRHSSSSSSCPLPSPRPPPSPRRPHPALIDGLGWTLNVYLSSMVSLVVLWIISRLFDVHCGLFIRWIKFHLNFIE